MLSAKGFPGSVLSEESIKYIGFVMPGSIGHLVNGTVSLFWIPAFPERERLRAEG